MAMRAVEYNHAMIHKAQKKELWYVFYYLLYALDYIILVLGGAGCPEALVCFEMEAVCHQSDAGYLKKRKKYSWKEYIF